MTIPYQWHQHHIMSSFAYTFLSLLCCEHIFKASPDFPSQETCNQKRRNRNNNVDTLLKWKLLATLSTIRSGLFITDKFPGGNGIWCVLPACFVHSFCFCHWSMEWNFRADSIYAVNTGITFSRIWIHFEYLCILITQQSYMQCTIL